MSDTQQPYTALAEIYDHVMSHVDYDAWGQYVASLIDQYGPDDPDILELGCGTGNVTVRLAQDFGHSYTATDNSSAMLVGAHNKLAGYAGVKLKQQDFRAISGVDRYDVVLLVYDGINYARSLDELESTLNGVAAVLRPGGLFLFDQSTPANSINNLSYFDDRYDGEAFSYSRTSSYDPSTRLHTTSFAIEIEGKLVTERHEQRAFTRKEMLRSARLTGFEVLGSLSAFGFDPADDDTERIQWVLREPQSSNPSAA
jgi:ubiquinone/menaquinone biosynthesis C-methylase UbiE